MKGFVRFSVQTEGVHSAGRLDENRAGAVFVRPGMNTHKTRRRKLIKIPFSECTLNRVNSCISSLDLVC